MTTIALKDDTYDMLTHVKEEIQAETYDETVKKLVLLHKQPKRSFFGKLKGLREEFTREEIDRFD
jgi:predicted CopG family antitoxin